MLNADQIIEMFGMKPLPGEGGFYAETYRCAQGTDQPHLPTAYDGPRSFSSAILYLLTPETYSRLHRLKSDELFHFYLGGPVTMLQLHPDGSSEVITLGPDILNAQRIQLVVPAGTWQGCMLNPAAGFALMGTTVAPGFEFQDLDLANREQLLQQYLTQKNLIAQLT